MQQQEQDKPELCTNGCGFFGHAASGGMCSICWKKTLSNRQAENSSAKNSKSSFTTETKAASTSENVSGSIGVQAKEVLDIGTTETTAETTVEKEEEKADEKPVQKNKKACWQCKKKVGFTGIVCRCGYVFCASHRYEDQHDCTFDFKSSGRAQLAKLNPGGGTFEKLEKL